MQRAPQMQRAQHLFYPGCCFRDSAEVPIQWHLTPLVLVLLVTGDTGWCLGPLAVPEYRALIDNLTNVSLSSFFPDGHLLTCLLTPGSAQAGSAPSEELPRGGKCMQSLPCPPHSFLQESDPKTDSIGLIVDPKAAQTPGTP